MSDVTIEHTLYFKTASGEDFGREFECSLVAEWISEHEMFDLTWLESDGVVIAPSWNTQSSPDEAALWDRCQKDLQCDADLISKAWNAHSNVRFEDGFAA